MTVAIAQSGGGDDVDLPVLCILLSHLYHFMDRCFPVHNLRVYTSIEELTTT